MVSFSNSVSVAFSFFITVPVLVPASMVFLFVVRVFERALLSESLDLLMTVDNCVVLSWI